MPRHKISRIGSSRPHAARELADVSETLHLLLENTQSVIDEDRAVRVSFRQKTQTKRRRRLPADTCSLTELQAGQLRVRSKTWLGVIATSSIAAT